MSRLLVVSNRLPVTLRAGEGGPDLVPSTGGLATGLRTPHERSEGRWIGWPGPLWELDAAERVAVEKQCEALRLVPVDLSAEQVSRYYDGYSNGVLWPLFHYMPWQIPPSVPDFDAYEAVNHRFADAVASAYAPGDTIWVHDYQLLLLPGLLRERLPEARIGFFLHIPFPSSELFRTLPSREAILEGMLGADLVGFHTAAYGRHFAASVLRILGIAASVDRIQHRGREIRLGVFPMGVDAASFGEAAAQPDVVAAAQALRGDGSLRLLVGIDRLDYTKGIPRRLLAFERLLADHPELHERVRFVQIAVPSRGDVGAYQEFRAQSEQLVGRINGSFGTPSWVPVNWIHRGLSRDEVIALYRAADVMVVTPLRDGMNLVAKEFVASRVDEDGALVLSEFAGAASELAEVFDVNPYDVGATAAALHAALSISREERRERMRALRRRVLAYDVHRWVREFLDALGDAASNAAPESLAATPNARLRQLAEELRSGPLALLLDYDGTLVPFAETPGLAAPGASLREQLAALATRDGFDVHVVSGRSPDVLERWLGDLPLALHAEHGMWSRASRDEPWHAREKGDVAWRESVLRILEDFAARTPGALVEEKTASVAWHYRAADPEFGARQAKELQIHLSEVLSNTPVEILPGNRVIEVRPYGVHKGRIATETVAALAPGVRVLAIGDDRTDEDLFAALPPEAITLHVGPAPSCARYRLADVAAARRFLGWLLEDGEAG